MTRTIPLLLCLLLWSCHPAEEESGASNPPAGASQATVPNSPPPPPVPPCGVVESERPVIDLTTTELRHRTDGATIEWIQGPKITFDRAAGSATLLPTKPFPDLNDSVILAVDVRNESDQPVTLLGEINNNRSSRGFLHLPAGAEGAMHLHLMRLEKNNPRAEQFPDMRGVPGGHMQHWDKLNASHLLKSLRLSDLDGQAIGKTITVTTIRALGRYGVLPEPGEDAFFPFVDQFGQYKHSSWPGKIASLADMQQARENESTDLDRHPGPTRWNQYGGWKSGPQLDATGHFRTAKHGGKWWLVDPEGCLFWSHGVTGVGGGAKTKLWGRKQFFELIPEAHREGGAVDFYKANLEKKYHAGWTTVSQQLAHRRLRSWGLNTFGNWSEPSVCAMRKTPYVVPIHYRSQQGDPRRDPQLLRKSLEAKLMSETTRSDPWCIGYFVDNELKWNEVMAPELYYKTVSEVVKRVAPNKLYLGSRLHGQQHVHGGPLPAATAAAKYCDVVSINRYRFSPADLQMPDGADKPILIGEFHFGALDRGMLHPGLRAVRDQRQRSEAYRHYLTEALSHPNIVGTHWFQYRQQAVTGRSDGENYQIGFVDIADTPSTELVDAARRIGDRMYTIRAGKAR